MIDIKLLRSSPEEVKIGIRKKGYEDSIVDKAIELDRKYRNLLQKEEGLRHLRKENSHENSGQKEGEKIKIELKKITQETSEVQRLLEEALLQIPNLPLQNVPTGQSEKDNMEMKKWGIISKHHFKLLDHLTLGEKLGILNFTDGAKVSGSQFYYLDNEGALLELALIQFGLQILMEEGFTPTLTPDLAKSAYYLGTGYLPKGKEAQTYIIEDEDLGLIATAEVTLAGRHAGEIIPTTKLPIKYAGLSHCFRKEAGAYGKYSKGLYRVHQFTKLEMFVYCLPEESNEMHAKLLAIEEKIWQKLEIPYRVLEMCTGDLGAIAAKKFDIEAWMPGREDYGEVTSTSNCTDFQARNLNIRVKKDGQIIYPHMLNGTALAISRAIIAILENYQNEDGSVTIPKVLQGFMGNRKKINPRN